MKVQELTKTEFLKKVANYEASPNKWVYKGDKPCIVDFYATWCGPCKMVAPILEELAEEYAGKIDIYKVDTEKEEGLAASFGIRSIPSLLFCPMNGQPQMAKGAMGKADFKKAITAVSLFQPVQALSVHIPHPAAWTIRHCCPHRYVAVRPAC